MMLTIHGRQPTAPRVNPTPHYAPGDEPSRDVLLRLDAMRRPRGLWARFLLWLTAFAP